MKTIAFKPYLVLILLTASLASAQKFVTIDNDTHEFIEDVDYTLYKEGKLVRHGITLNDAATVVDGKEFDSISFSRIDYEVHGFLKDSLPEAVFLTKKTIYLDEVVISPQKDKEIVLGEAKRIIKSRARFLVKELEYGIMFSNNMRHSLQLNRLVFYIGKIKYKTAYRIKLYDADESYSDVGHRFLKQGEVEYASDILYVSKKDGKKVEIDLPAGLQLAAGKSLFVQIELVAYYDKDSKEMEPDKDDRTKLAFQLSNDENYFCRTGDYHTGELSSYLLNVNALINYDFANQFYTTPHKSSLVAPAMVLYAKKAQ